MPSGILQLTNKWISAKNKNIGNNTGIENINDSDYNFSLWLVNQDDQALMVRRDAIEELVVVDDMTEAFHNGHLILRNPHDALERGSSVALDGDYHNTTNSTSFHFRNDARDCLYLRFEPSMDVTDRDGSTTGQVDDVIHTIEFLFVIYATEDILDPDAGPDEKKQRIFFHDYRYQMLLEKNLYYSTARSLPIRGQNKQSKTPVEMRSNDGRGKATGEIVQDILTSALYATDTVPLFSNEWEYGEEKMLYTSGGNNKAIDDLEYILGRHVSSESKDHQPCILKLQRKTDRWELLPVSTYFARATTMHNGERLPGIYQSEAFKISTTGEGDSGIPPQSKAFHDRYTSTHINYHYSNLSMIDDYSFTELSGLDCQNILNTTIVHNYNESSKRFNVDFRGNVTNVQDMYKEKYLPHMLGIDGGSGHMSWAPSKTQEDNLNIRNVSSPFANPTLGLAYGRNKTIINSLLLGNSIQFEVTGMTTRRSGVWMTVNRNNTYVDNEYESKVLGQYLIRRVEHRIIGNKYTTVVTGVKPYYFKDLGFSDGDILYKSPTT